MTDFATHTHESAPADAKPLLEAAQSKYGFTPNLLATMATSPALLKGYMTLAGIFDESKLTETERQVVMMTNNRLNGCTYCMAAHTTISQMAKVPADVVTSLRNGTAIADPKLEALRQFAITVNETRGWPTTEQIDALIAAGYTQETVLEVVLGTAVKVMSNYTNHIAETKLDQAFQSNAWSSDKAAA